jgi:undecaprenyl-diphosphatase
MTESSTTNESWRRSEVIALVLVVLSITLFGTLTMLISAPGIQEFDDSVIFALRDPNDASNPIGPDWLEELARDCTALGGYGVLTILTTLLAVFLSVDQQKRRSWYMVAVILGGYLVSMGLKAAVGRSRPDLVPTLTHFHSTSFPSGHAMMSAVVYGTFSLTLADLSSRQRFGWLLIVAPLLISLLVGFTRVYLGVHFLTDVVAGWSIGMTWAVGWWLAGRRWSAARSRQQIR